MCRQTHVYLHIMDALCFCFKWFGLMFLHEWKPPPYDWVYGLWEKQLQQCRHGYCSRWLQLSFVVLFKWKLVLGFFHF